MDDPRIFKYMDATGKFSGDDISITITETDTLNDIKEKLKPRLPQLTQTQDIFFTSGEDDQTRINTIDALKKHTGIIVVTIAEALDGGRRRRSSTPRKSSSRRRRSTKRRTASRKQQKRRRGSRRAH